MPHVPTAPSSLDRRLHDHSLVLAWLGGRKYLTTNDPPLLADVSMREFRMFGNARRHDTSEAGNISARTRHVFSLDGISHIALLKIDQAWADGPA